MLLSAASERGVAIAERLGLSVAAVGRSRRRFLDTGVEGLATRPKAGRKDHAVPGETVERVVQLALVAATSGAQSVDDPTAREGDRPD